jgi:hypothetical protein
MGNGEDGTIGQGSHFDLGGVFGGSWCHPFGKKLASHSPFAIHRSL